MASCKKESQLVIASKPAESTKDIIVKSGFKWENSKDINFTIDVVDVQYPKTIHVISIYDGDPMLGGNLISKGSATTTVAFKSKIYLPNHISSVYVVGAFPNGSNKTIKLPITKADLSLTISL